MSYFSVLVLLFTWVMLYPVESKAVWEVYSKRSNTANPQVEKSATALTLAVIYNSVFIVVGEVTSTHMIDYPVESPPVGTKSSLVKLYCWSPFHFPVD